MSYPVLTCNEPYVYNGVSFTEFPVTQYFLFIIYSYTGAYAFKPVFDFHKLYYTTVTLIECPWAYRKALAIVLGDKSFQVHSFPRINFSF